MRKGQLIDAIRSAQGGAGTVHAWQRAAAASAERRAHRGRRARPRAPDSDVSRRAERHSAAGRGSGPNRASASRSGPRTASASSGSPAPSVSQHRARPDPASRTLARAARAGRRATDRQRPAHKPRPGRRVATTRTATTPERSGQRGRGGDRTTESRQRTRQPEPAGQSREPRQPEPVGTTSNRGNQATTGATTTRATTTRANDNQGHEPGQPEPQRPATGTTTAAAVAAGGAAAATGRTAGAIGPAVAAASSATSPSPWSPTTTSSTPVARHPRRAGQLRLRPHLRLPARHRRRVRVAVHGEEVRPAQGRRRHRRHPAPRGTASARRSSTRWSGSTRSTAAIPSRRRTGPEFAKLTPLYPQERLKLETTPEPADRPDHRPARSGRQGSARPDRLAAQGRQDDGHAGDRQRDHHQQPRGAPDGGAGRRASRGGHRLPARRARAR